MDHGGLEAQQGGGAFRVDGHGRAPPGPGPERAAPQVGAEPAQRFEVPVEGEGDAGQIVAEGDGHRRLVVGVGRHHRRPVPARPGQQHRQQPQALAHEPLVGGPEPQQQDGGVDVVAGPARPQHARRLNAEPGDEPVLVEQVEPPPGLPLPEWGEIEGAEPGDLGEEGPRRLPGDDALLGQHDQVGPVDLAEPGQLLRPGLGGSGAEDDPAGGGGERPVDATGVVHAHPAPAVTRESVSSSTAIAASPRSAAAWAASEVLPTAITWPSRSRKEPVIARTDPHGDVDHPGDGRCLLQAVDPADAAFA